MGKIALPIDLIIDRYIYKMFGLVTGLIHLLGSQCTLIVIYTDWFWKKANQVLCVVI